MRNTVETKLKYAVLIETITAQFHQRGIHIFTDDPKKRSMKYRI